MLLIDADPQGSLSWMVYSSFLRGILIVTTVPPPSRGMIVIPPSHIISSRCRMLFNVVWGLLSSEGSKPGPLSSTMIAVPESVFLVRMDMDRG